MYVASNGVKTAVILNDDDPMNPRDPGYQDNITTMTCWHRRYNLGDSHAFDSPRDFLVDLVERHVTDPEFFQFVKEGGVEHLRLVETHQGEDGPAAANDRYVVQCRYGGLDEGGWASTECLVSEDMRRVSGPLHAVSGLLDYVDRFELQDLLSKSNNVIVKPLYLYDHSGITISTGSFLGRALHAEWDSGQVGYIHMDKKTAMTELAMPTEGGYKPLTDKNWKVRAEQYLEADVKEYDNYLRGEIYGYRTYEGLEEVDSCWGYNPGNGDIEQLMKEELGGWFGPGLEFEYDSCPYFDIDDYFETHGFPELRERIWNDTYEYLNALKTDSAPYPFEIPLGELLDNKDGVLGDIVTEIYEEHMEPTPERIREALDEHAGVSREVKPKLTAADLSPDRDYTIEELMDLAKQKTAKRAALSGAEQAFGKLAEMIAQKASKREGPEL